MSTLKKTKRNRRPNNQLKNPVTRYIVPQVASSPAAHQIAFTFVEVYIGTGGNPIIGSAVPVMVTGVPPIRDITASQNATAAILSSDSLTLTVTFGTATVAITNKFAFVPDNGIRGFDGATCPTLILQ